ncbi:hypothetical protein VTJ83DRAFT_7200 [Remersonia thermophila]|uniref:F-box domain-containing protein n=1 Tax=Remersonia thermophila TaxID=72144 RepID=A0ABR4D3U4_9PEZI
MSILHLPHELVSYIVGYLDLDDIYSLGRTCRHFASLILHEQSFTRWLLQKRAPFSVEAREAEAREAEGEITHPAQFRRLLQRREAIASVSPFLAALVAYAHEWSYSNGVLCYTRGLELRVRDLHGSAKREVVVDVRALLRELGAWHPRQRYSLRVLHHSHSIVSCLYSHAPPGRAGAGAVRHWLVALRVPGGALVAAKELASVHNLFVRNTDRFLYYGRTSEPDEEGHEYWSIGMLHLSPEQQVTVVGSREAMRAAGTKTPPQERTIPEVIGIDVGSTVCFEIYGDHFYVLSSQRTTRTYSAERDSWASYYFCLRCRLGCNNFSEAEKPPDSQLWRRNHKKEGPMDDRWSFLCLSRDEATGRLQAVECRQEYPPGGAGARRTYYTTPIDFTDAVSYSDDMTAAGLKDAGPPPPRNPCLVQPGDTTLSMPLPVSRCLVRSYHWDCQAYVDLVDVSESFDPKDQRLCIRGGSRRPRHPGTQADRRTARREDDGCDSLMQHIDNLHKSRTGIFWPPKPDPFHPDPALADLYRVLNPPGHLGKPVGTWDDRSLVYSAGKSKDGLHALVFLSFDPAIHLPGTTPYPTSSGRRAPPTPSPSPWENANADKDARAPHRYLSLPWGYRFPC